MAQVSMHPNLVTLIGVVSAGEPKLLVLSYCEHGSLLSALVARGRDAGPLSPQHGVASPKPDPEVRGTPRGAD